MSDKKIGKQKGHEIILCPFCLSFISYRLIRPVENR